MRCQQSLAPTEQADPAKGNQLLKPSPRGEGGTSLRVTDEVSTKALHSLLLRLLSSLCYTSSTASRSPCLAAARAQNGSCIINAIHYRSAASLPSRGRLKKASPARQKQAIHCRDRRPRRSVWDNPQGKPSCVILSERMRVEALRSAGGAKPRNEVTKGSCKDYSQPILLLLFATKERDPSTPLRFAQDDTEYLASRRSTWLSNSPTVRPLPHPTSSGAPSRREP